MANNQKIAIFGTSGFSREVLDVCVDLGYREIIFIGYGGKEKEYFGYPLIDEGDLLTLKQDDYAFVIGIGDNTIRKKVADKYESLQYINLIHPSASFGDKQRQRIEEKQGNIITAGVRITNNVQMGNFGIFNLNCTIGHDCIIEDFVNIAPGANISGNVRLSEGSYIGTNAAVLQGDAIDKKMVIGRYATVGAGAVVTRSVPDNAIVKGAPARQAESTIKGNVQYINGANREKNHNNRGGGAHPRPDFFPQSLAA